MSAQEIILAIGGGLLVNEFCDISPWAAKRIVVWSAHLRYGRSARAEMRAEEHCAVIDSRPGKLCKLLTALVFASGASIARLHQAWLLLRLLLWAFSYEFDPTITIERNDLVFEIRARQRRPRSHAEKWLKGEKRGLLYESERADEQDI